MNPFTKTSATAQQTSDLLNFRVIGQNEFHSRISFYILREPSSTAPMRKKQLLTFSTKKVGKKRVSQLEKDRKFLMSCLRKKTEMVHAYRESYTNSRGTIDCITTGNIRPSRDPTERSKALHDKSLRKTVQKCSTKSFSLTIPTRMAATMLHSGRDVYDKHSSSWKPHYIW